MGIVDVAYPDAGVEMADEGELLVKPDAFKSGQRLALNPVF